MSRIARDLKVSRSTLYRKLKQYGLEQFTLALTQPMATTKTTRKPSGNSHPNKNSAVMTKESSVGTSLDHTSQV
jgi:transposase-like protein